MLKYEFIQGVTAKVAPHVSVDPSGIIVRNGKYKISLDPSHLSDCDFTFVSHAHVDHLHKRSKKKPVDAKILASNATSLIARTRGYEIGEVAEAFEGFELVDTGHILGSRGLLAVDDFYYTGDISTRDRGFLKGARLPKVSTLIIESTFGRPEYIFPGLDTVVHKTNKIISEMYDLGIPVILMGYPLGKAQILTEFFGHWDPIYIHDSVAKMNSVYSSLGVPLKCSSIYSEAEANGMLSKNKPWVMIAPLMHGRTAFVKDMKEKYGAVTVGFSGWAVNSRYKYMMGLDYVMPMSDHCDFDELVAAVKSCNPEKVYTFHGFASDFANALKKMGFDAEPIADRHSKKNETPLKKNEKGAKKSLTLDVFQD